LENRIHDDGGCTRNADLPPEFDPLGNAVELTRITIRCASRHRSWIGSARTCGKLTPWQEAQRILAFEEQCGKSTCNRVFTNSTFEETGAR